MVRGAPAALLGLEEDLELVAEAAGDDEAVVAVRNHIEAAKAVVVVRNHIEAAKPAERSCHRVIRLCRSSGEGAGEQFLVRCVAADQAEAGFGQDVQAHMTAGFGPFIGLLGRHGADQARPSARPLIGVYASPRPPPVRRI